jgi:hypothetical protein
MLARQSSSLPLLWRLLRLIFGIDIGFDHTRCRTGMIGRGLPGTLQQFDPSQFLHGDAAPVIGRADRRQTAFAFPAVLIAQHSWLFGTIPT